MLSEVSAELVLHVYNNLNSISDVINLSLVCRRFHALLPAARKLSTLFAAAEREFGPLHDAIQIVVLQNEAPHADRDPPLSFSLLRQLVSLGRVAQKFERLYPRWKWNENFVQRRGLTDDEKYRLRRAIYRIWRYSAAFYSPKYPRTTRMLRSSFEKRAMMLRFPTSNLLELEDMRRIMQEIISTLIVPKHSDSRRHIVHKWPPEDAPGRLCVGNIFHAFESVKHDYTPNFFDDEGFGDDVSQYYVVQDLLKLDPGQIIWLMDNATRKWEVEAFIRELGDWFPNNGETLAQTLHMVLLARGDDDLLSDGDFGVAGNNVTSP